MASDAATTAALLEQMVRLLEEEHEVLRRRDGEALAALAPRKAELCRRIEALDAPAAAAAAGPAERERLRELARRCRHQNTINGMLAENQRRLAEHGLALLQGRSTETLTYGPGGGGRGGPRAPLGRA